MCSNYPLLPLILASEACGGTMTIQAGQSREIMSPKYPLLYPASSKCIWKISTSQNSVVSIQFVDFETEPLNDVVDVRDGITETDHLLASLSGARQTKTYFTTGPNLLVKFSSDFINSRRGFKAIIRAGIVLKHYFIDFCFYTKM